MQTEEKEERYGENRREPHCVFVFLARESKKPTKKTSDKGMTCKDVFKSKFGAPLFAALKARAALLERGQAFRVVFCASPTEATEKLQDGKATSWKLLTCPRCNIVANRDRSAASVIAANHERRMLAKRFNCTAPAHAGYARGPDSNILHQDAG